MKKMRKVLPLVTILAGITLLLASAGWADIPAPPANQQIGIDDGIFNTFVEAECRLCHDDPDAGDPTPNVTRHHLLYGDPLPQGLCSVNREATCLSDADCNGGEVCIGETVVPNIDADKDGTPDINYGCLSCHEQDTSSGVITFLVERDCLQCHVQIPGEASVHHLSATAQGIDSPLGDPDVGDCTPCHGTLVDDIGDGHTIPTYDPSLVTPDPSTGTCSDDPSTACNKDRDCLAGTCNVPPGGCNYCHSSGTGDPADPGTDTATATLVYGNSVTHHNTGVYQSETGVINDTVCLWCHDFTPPFEDPIRTCEGCHGLESLHNIQADSDASGDIVVGGELAGYGHVGRDAGPGDSDCWGCHGFSASSAPGSGPVTPYISSSDTLVITAGTDTAVNLTGTAFTNLIGTYQWISDVALTAADDSSVILTPDSITQGELTVTIPGTTTPGNYTLQAVKDENTASNPVALSIKPEVMIADVSCEEDLLTITGSGFGDAPPEGAEEYINVGVDGVPVEIISWTETEVKTSVSDCSGTVTVNALYGSDTYDGSDCEMCYADFNHDSAVNLDDFIIMIVEYSRFDCEINSCQADCNGDGRVGINDLIILIIEFFKGNCC